MSENMTTSEPTTGEIVRALQYCVGKDTICGTACPAHLSEAGCRTTIMKNAADRLESQERELSGITGELEQYKKWHDESIATATNNIVELEHRVAALTARTEQAEKERDAAVKDIEELLGQDDYIGICWACNNHDKCVGTRDVKITCVPKWRGLPQDGEGK